MFLNTFVLLSSREGRLNLVKISILCLNNECSGPSDGIPLNDSAILDRAMVIV